MAGNKVVRRSVTAARGGRGCQGACGHGVAGPGTRRRPTRCPRRPARGSSGWPRSSGYQHHMMARGCAGVSARPSGWSWPTSGTPTPPRSARPPSRLEGADYMALMTESLDDSQSAGAGGRGHLLARQVDGLVLLAVRSGEPGPGTRWASRVPVVAGGAQPARLRGAGREPTTTSAGPGWRQRTWPSSATAGFVQLPGPAGHFSRSRTATRPFAEAAAELGLEGPGR
jgi:hypothetical protein